MTNDSDVMLTGLVLIAAAFVLAAPVLGRAGFPFAADLLVSAAAISGVGALLIAAAHSLLRLRTDERSRKQARSEKPGC